MNIWAARDKKKPQAILFVTHNIEEAAEIADKILIFGSDPGYVKAELPVRMPYPRLKTDYIKEIVDDIYFLMTTPLPHNKIRLLQEVDFNKIELSYRLPEAEPNQLQALVAEIYLQEPNKAIDLPVLVDLVPINIDEFFSLTEAMQILHLAKISKGDIALSEDGKRFAQADVQTAKEIFAELLNRWVPIIPHICTLLNNKERHKVKEEEILEILEESLSESEAERVFKVIISWGRYAELFAYDYEYGVLSLENPV
jgi:NitT/TauT family transport system ATP-binding protein